jgi:hypothetical protein
MLNRFNPVFKAVKAPVDKTVASYFNMSETVMRNGKLVVISEANFMLPINKK